MTMTRKQRKRAATAGAVVMMLGVLHLSTKDASGQELPPSTSAPTTTPCVDEYHGPDGTVEEIPCDQWSPCPGVMLGWKVPTKYYPDRCPPPTPPSPHPTNTVATVQPPMQGVPTPAPVLPAPPTIPTVVDAVTITTPVIEEDAPKGVIEEDDPRWDCHTMGNKRCGPNVAPSAAPAARLPSTGSAEAIALAGVGAAMLVAGTVLVIAFPKRRKQIVIDLPMIEG